MSLVLAAAILTLLLAIYPAVASARAETPAERLHQPAALAAPTANCRYATVPLETAQYPGVATMGAGWYLTFWPWKPGSSIAPANGAEFVHVVRIHQEKVQDADGRYHYLPEYYTNPPLEDIVGQLERYPGDLWVLGNEVDRGPDNAFSQSKQGDMFPEIYARAFKEVGSFIKHHDPHARLAISALVEVTPGRLNYLDRVWDSYQNQFGRQMPVDVFNMHLYILPEVRLVNGQKVPSNVASVAVGTDPKLGIAAAGGDASLCPVPGVYCIAEHDDIGEFGAQIVAMRQWMKDHGQQNKPLILSEYSVLWPYTELPDGDCQLQDEFGNCFPPQRVADFMLASFDFMNNTRNPSLGYPLDNNRLIQGWLWYAVNAGGEGSASGLMEEDLKSLTLPGLTFQSHVAAEPATRNLVVESVPRSYGTTFGQPTGNATISVNFRNNGNHSVAQPFKVTFYANAGRTQIIGSTTVRPPVTGCATHAYTASFVWDGLAPGTHRFWVHVDSGLFVDEGGQEGDNFGTGLVTIYTHGLALPAARTD